jgi:hypothetical protein
VELESEIEKGSTFRLVFPTRTLKDSVERAGRQRHTPEMLDENPETPARESQMHVTR